MKHQHEANLFVKTRKKCQEDLQFGGKKLDKFLPIDLSLIRQ